MEGQHQAMNRPVTVVSVERITDDRSRWATITAEASVGVPQRRLGVMEDSLLWLVTMCLVQCNVM